MDWLPSSHAGNLPSFDQGTYACMPKLGTLFLRQTRLSGGSNQEVITDLKAIGPQSRHTQKAPQQRSIANGPYHRRTHMQHRLITIGQQDSIQNTWRREGAKASSTAQLGKAKCLQAALEAQRSHQHRKGKGWKGMVWQSLTANCCRYSFPLQDTVRSCADLHKTVWVPRRGDWCVGVTHLCPGNGTTLNDLGPSLDTRCQDGQDRMWGMWGPGHFRFGAKERRIPQANVG